MGAPRLVSGTHNPVAWHLDCYQLWPAMASRMTSMPGLSRLSPAHQVRRLTVCMHVVAQIFIICTAYRLVVS